MYDYFSSCLNDRNNTLSSISVYGLGIDAGADLHISARGLEAWPGGWIIINANVAHNHSPLQPKFFEKYHILFIKGEILVIRILKNKSPSRAKIFEK